jgi:tRNA G18 (ribose-2'-O)-methylase SpoU
MLEKKSMEELQRLSVEAFHSSKKLPLIVILDQVRSALNVGSIFRSSDAFSVEAIYLCGYTPCPPQREILKSALGSTETVQWRHFETTQDALSNIPANFEIWALEQTHNSVPLHEFKPQTAIALILGNEVDGVSDEVLAHCKGSLEIEQYGTKHSLNVSVSAGIALFHLSQQLKDL